MKATSANLLTVLKGPKQFVVPIYQRTYSWQKTQCEQLMNDIKRTGTSSMTSGHFVGSLVYFQESIYNTTDVPQLLVIDGQQRITTVSLIILALAEFMQKNTVEVETNSAKLRNYYLLNAEEDSELRYKLLLTRRDKETLISLLNENPLPPDHSVRIVDNLNYFRQAINAENAVAVYNGVMRLFVVDVTLEKEKDNPQLIFESMNSTGLDLTQADLIRNYVLMGQEIKVQTKLYERYWYPMEKNYGNDYTAYFDRFMRYYLSARTGELPNIGNVYATFKTFAQGKLIEDLVAEITEYAGYYARMMLLKETDKALLTAFQTIGTLRVEVVMPFLLSVYKDYQQQEIDKATFLQILELVESYVFRRAICGVPANSLNKTFLTLYKSVRKDDYYNSVAATMQLFNGYKRFPNDVEFARELKIKDLYGFRTKMYFFDKLENINRKEQVHVNDYTVEHIMPQNESLNHEWQQMLGPNWRVIQETYLHTVGNLTLTGYNSELSDRPFAEKKKIEGGFDNSPLRLNTFMKTVNEWNQDMISARADQLIGQAMQIWKYPNISADVLSKYAAEEKRVANEYTVADHEYLKGEMLNIYYELRKRILGLDEAVKEEIKKLYIAYKTSTNFTDIVPQKSRLRLTLNMPFSEIKDPLGICEDVTGLGHWGNGDVEVSVYKMDDINKVMDMVQQALDYQEQ